MRRALIALIATSTLAGCADLPTFSPAAAKGWESPRSSADRSAGRAPAVLDVHAVGQSQGGRYHGQNLPLPHVGGGRAVL